MSLKKALEHLKLDFSSDEESHGRVRKSVRPQSPKETTASASTTTNNKQHSLTFAPRSSTGSTTSHRSSIWSRHSDSASSSTSPTPHTSKSPNSHHHKHKKTSSPSASPKHSLTRNRPRLKPHFSHTACTGSNNSSLDRPLNEEGLPMSKNQLRKFLRNKQKEISKKLQEKREQDRRHRFETLAKEAEKNESPEMQSRYGTLPIITSAETDKLGEKRMNISGLSAENIGQEVSFRARVHKIRPLSSKLAFIIFRQQITTVQGVMELKRGQKPVRINDIGNDAIDNNGREGSSSSSATATATATANQTADVSATGPTSVSGASGSDNNVVVDGPSPHMMFWAQHLAPESIVLVKGIVRKPKVEVKSTTIHDVEIDITELHVLSAVNESLPFDVYEAEVLRESNPKVKNTISTTTRLDHRVLDLRTSASQAIFRINSAITNLFRTYLDARGFIEIHTPKLQGAATESGASVFQLNYFGRPGYLAQSPQLAKQMAIAADFERVYEIGPVFRAENSNTKRHLTEYTGLDLEMAIEENYHEALNVIDGMFKAVFKGIYERNRRELEAVKESFPHEDLVWLEETPRLTFAEGIKLLRDSGYKDEGKEDPPSELEDLSTRAEIRLGELVKEKYKTDFYILDKFPAVARPFYTMPNPNDPEKLTTNSFDIFLRGQEVLSGGQRIHDANMLVKHMKQLGLHPEAMKEYVDAFRWGAPPHAGGGIGLERVVMLLLGLGNIRLASLFHRDPRSLPKQPPLGGALRHPEASTLNPPWEMHEGDEEKEMQPIEKLIANYGDAGNTSWLDERFHVWRDDDTGAAVGYVPKDGFAITIGDPLCDDSQKAKVIVTYVRHLRKHAKLKPVWMLASKDVQRILGENLGWSTLTCANEERVDTMDNPAQHDQNIQRKIRHAEKEGVKITDIRPLRPGEEGDMLPRELIVEIDERINDWIAARKGKQAHLTKVRPWIDQEHRRYFYARDSSGKVCALAVLAQLAPKYGYQFKFALDFPGAPNGTIEMIIMHALDAAAASGIKNVTFGTGATKKLTPGYNISGAKTQLLMKTYTAVSTAFRLVDKSEFREKLGATGDPSYVCYPRGSLRYRGIKAIIKMVESDD